MWRRITATLALGNGARFGNRLQPFPAVDARLPIHARREQLSFTCINAPIKIGDNDAVSGLRNTSAHGSSDAPTHIARGRR